MRSYARYCMCFLALTVLLACRFSSVGVQGQSAAEVSQPLLTVRGVSPAAVNLTAADLERLPHRSVKVTDRNGAEITYEGVPLSEALKRAGMNFEADLHGRGLTRYLLVEAADKYRIVFALPEIDPAFTDRLILLAMQRDGKPLSQDEGPLRIIVPEDKHPARWVRQVRVLSIIDAVPAEERNKKP